MTRQGPVIHEYSTSSVISEKLRILVLFDNYYTLLYIDNYTYIITFIRKWLVYVNFHPLFAIDPWHNLWYLCIITVQNLEITCVIWVLWKLFACCNNLLIAFWSRCHISLVAFVTLLNLTTKTIASLQLIKKLTGICVTVIPSSILNPWQYFLLVTKIIKLSVKLGHWMVLPYPPVAAYLGAASKSCVKLFQAFHLCVFINIFVLLMMCPTLSCTCILS